MSLALLIVSLLNSPSSAREISLTLDAAPIEAPRAPVDAAALSAPLSLDLPLTPATPVLNPTAAVGLTAQAQTQTALPALPKSALTQTPRAAASQTAAVETQSAQPQSLEEAAAGAAVRFDKALAAQDEDGGAVSNWKMTFGAEAAAHYRSAVGRASRSGWTEGGLEVRDSARALLTQAGVESIPIDGKNRAGADSPGLRIAPVLGRGALNELAYHLKKGLDVDLDYLPERTGDAVGAYNGREKRLMLAHLDRPEFFLGLLHEARHAYYTALLTKGEVRLFHAAVVARPGRTVSPYATVYASYLSLEELSTFPKTLKHLLSAIRDADPATAEKLAAIAGVRIRQYGEFLRTTLHLAGQVRALDNNGKLSLREMDPTESDRVGLEPLAKGAYFALELSQASVYWPFETGDSRTWLQRTLGAEDKLALDSLRLKTRLLQELVEKNAAPAAAYQDALARGDFADAGRQADQLIKATVEADRDWRVGYAALLARGK